jgi:hypothetical protein
MKPFSLAALALAFCFQAQAQPKSAPVSFQISEFKAVPERFSLSGRGLLKVARPDFRDKIIAVRLRYALRLKNEPFVHNSTSWVVITNGVGLLEVNAFLPEVVLNSIKTEKDYPIFEWSVDGWFRMNPGTVGDAARSN